MFRGKMPTEVIVLQQVEVAHLLSHGDLLHSALVQVELLSNVNITVQNKPQSIQCLSCIHSTFLQIICFHVQWKKRKCAAKIYPHFNAHLVSSSSYFVMKCLSAHLFCLF